MQIGVGKSGVKIGEYANEQDGNGVLGWIEPACKNPRWILWFDSKGDGILYSNRADSGAMIGEPIRLKARNPIDTKCDNLTLLKQSLPKITLGDK